MMTIQSADVSTGRALAHRMLGRRSVTFGITMMLALVYAHRASATFTGVSMEAVDHYHSSQWPDIICIAEADNFRNGLLSAPGTIFTPGIRWVDDQVYDTDYYDPEATGSLADDDQAQFDMAPNATAYSCLHGNCDDMTSQTCTASSQCTRPGSGQSLPGVCIGNGPPNNSPGWCAYFRNRKMYNGIIINNQHGHIIDYTGGGVKWGEDLNSTGWAGVGTNGAIGFGLLSDSCGVRPGAPLVGELLPLFAGMSVLGIVMPVTRNNPVADDTDAPERGTALSNAYRTNPNGSVGHAWSDSIAGVPQTDGGDCPGQGTSYHYGGGQGIAGCGAQLTMTMDSTQNFAYWDRDTQNWVDTINDIKSYGNAYYALRWVCNYACNTYPFTL